MCPADLLHITKPCLEIDLLSLQSGCLRLCSVVLARSSQAAGLQTQTWWIQQEEKCLLCSNLVFPCSHACWAGAEHPHQQQREFQWLQPGPVEPLPLQELNPHLNLNPRVRTRVCCQENSSQELHLCWHSGDADLVPRGSVASLYQRWSQFLCFSPSNSVSSINKCNNHHVEYIAEKYLYKLNINNYNFVFQEKLMWTGPSLIKT